MNQPTHVFNSWRSVWIILAVFALVAVYVVSGYVWPGEHTLLLDLHAAQSDTGKSWMKMASDFGRGQFLLPLALCPLLWLVVKKRWRGALFLIACYCVSVINPLLKLVIHRNRPANFDGHLAQWNYGFPSGHAMLSFAVVSAFIILLRGNSKRGALFNAISLTGTVLGLVLVGLIGWSRIYLNMHYASDVLGSWLFSAAWVLAMRLHILERVPLPQRQAVSTSELESQNTSSAMNIAVSTRE